MNSRQHRVKDLQGDYRLTDRILTLLRAARIVVADLSHDRPNIYFESALGTTPASRSAPQADAIDI